MDDWMERFQKAIEDRGPQIRPMVEGDLDEVLRIIRLHDSDDYKAAKRSFEGYNYSMPQRRGAHIVLVDRGEQRVVGVCGHYIDDLEADGVHWLGWTYVNPYFRGKGYGTLLLNHVIAELRRLKARKLFLSTSSLDKFAKAVRFYERNGFRLEGQLKDYYREGEDQLILGLRLSMD